MKDPIKHDRIKPGMEEALHPEIGNEVSWTSDIHSYSLSVPDPLKSIEHHLMDDETRKKITDQWKNGLSNQEEAKVNPSLHSGMPSLVTKTFPEETETPISQIDPEQVATRLDELEDDEHDFPVMESKKERKKREKADLKFSKRIKKVAEKVKKEENSSRAEKAALSRAGEETHLSPFTNWLKGLRGSEYVHPYHDDYALSQGSEVSGEGISETFADLLAAQGHKDQAIAMYTQLMEKFPEKSRFFAAKIEALQ